MISVILEFLEIFLAGRGVTVCGRSKGQDSFYVVEDGCFDHRLECCQDFGDVKVGVCVGPSDPTHHAGHIAIEMDEACRSHGLPITSDCRSFLPVTLESLQWKKINVSIALA